MWTAQNRRRYDRSQLRYPSDLTDDEWSHVAPLIPSVKPGGNKRSVDVREVMNGIMYVLSTGCQWRAVPKDMPPRSTLFDYLNLWSYDGTLDRIHHALYLECREQGEREASPTAAISPRPPQIAAVPARPAPERAPRSAGVSPIRQSHQNDIVSRFTRESRPAKNPTNAIQLLADES
jgi:transposase